jgi:hypothetical protein
MYAPGGCSGGSSCYVHTDFRCSPGCGSGPEYSLGDPQSPWTLLESYFNPAPPPPPAAPSFLPPGALNRYASVGGHWVTTGGAPDSGYGFEFTLGFLALDPGANERRLYSCVTGGGDHFVSVDPGCEAQSDLGPLGDVYTRPPRTGLEVLGLYRCTVNQNGEHFVSPDPRCESQHTESLLGYVTASQNRFDRYVMPGGNHFDTARAVGFGAVLESTLGFVLPNPATGRHALYSCFIGNDQFTSLDPGCEGQRVIGLEGWVYSSRPSSWPQKVAIYRCTVSANGEHFVSSNPGCEGQHTEGVLGYLAQTQTALDRFANPAAGDHWVTTRAVGSGYQFEERLGYMLQRDGPNRHALYSCVAGTDHFMSPDPRCEGQNPIGLDGWAYNGPPAGHKVTAVYRCTVKTSGDHFVSAAASCEGQNLESLLGYLAATPGGAYAPATCVVPTLRHRTLSQARAALVKRHCELGAVHRPSLRRRHHVLHVTRQSAKPGSKHPVGFRVRIWLR